MLGVETADCSQWRTESQNSLGVIAWFKTEDILVREEEVLVEQVGEAACLFDFENDLCIDVPEDFPYTHLIRRRGVIFQLGHCDNGCVEGAAKNYCAVGTLAKDTIEAVGLLIKTRNFKKFGELECCDFVYHDLARR